MLPDAPLATHALLVVQGSHLLVQRHTLLRTLFIHLKQPVTVQFPIKRCFAIVESLEKFSLIVFLLLRFAVEHLVHCVLLLALHRLGAALVVVVVDESCSH